jgi:hypothetical protein
MDGISKKGFTAFEPKENCKTENLSDPIYEYGREDGQSITGGYVYTGKEISALTGKYIFADFMSGRIWALTVPDKASEKSKFCLYTGKMACSDFFFRERCRWKCICS